MELDPFAQRLLEITREARTPSERDKQRVERALAVSLGLATATAAGSASAAALSGASAAPAASGSATGLVALKWIGAVAVAASALTAGYVAFAPADPEPVAPKAPAQKVAARAVEPPPAPVVDSEPAPEAPVAPRAARSAPEKAKKPETLAEELDLLHDAQAKWRNRDAAGALELIAQHKKRYPKSALAPERDALRVFSLCAAGRTDEARAVARRSFANAPRSPLRTAVEESCAKP